MINKFLARSVAHWKSWPARSRRSWPGLKMPSAKKVTTDFTNYTDGNCLGKRPSKEPSRRVRYDRAQLIPEGVCDGKKLYRKPEKIKHKFFKFCIPKFRHSNHRIGAHTCANHTVPYGTALLGWRCPRHFRARLRSHRPSGTFRNRL
jgi:hypothetical protein